MLLVNVTSEGSWSTLVLTETGARVVFSAVGAAAAGLFLLIAVNVIQKLQSLT